MSRSKRRRQLRFIVGGESWEKPNHGWRIKCSRCANTKLMVSSHGKILPPEAIIKKLTDTGWRIGNGPKEDICKDCQRRPERPQSNIGFAKQTLAGIAAPLVPVNGQRMHFDELLVAAKGLEPDQARQLINVLRERIPKRPLPKPKPLPQPEADGDYQRWLNEQE